MGAMMIIECSGDVDVNLGGGESSYVRDSPASGRDFMRKINIVKTRS